MHTAQEFLNRVQTQANGRNLEVISRLLRKRLNRANNKNHAKPNKLPDDIFLCGRYNFHDENDNCLINHVDIFCTIASVNQKVKYQLPEKIESDFLNLTPITKCTQSIEDDIWKKYHKSGGKQILVHLKVWKSIKFSDEIEIFQNGMFHTKYRSINRPYA